MSFGIKRNSSPGKYFKNFWNIYFMSLELLSKLSEDLDLGRFTPT